MQWVPFLVLLRALDPAVSQPADGEVDGEGREVLLYGAEVALASTYVFRGELQYGSATIPSFQPSLDIALPDLGPGALGFAVWAAIAMADWERINQEGSSSEVDLEISYEASLLDDWLLLTGGFTYYLYPHGEPVDGEKEIMVEVALGNLPIALSVGFWTEVHPSLGLYIEPRVSWGQTIGNLSVSTDLILGASAYRDAEATLEHATLTLGIGQTVGSLTFGVSLSYAIGLAPSQGSFMDRSLLFGAVSMRYEGSLRSTGEPQETSSEGHLERRARSRGPNTARISALR
jgi:hypothetical protein